MYAVVAITVTYGALALMWLSVRFVEWLDGRTPPHIRIVPELDGDLIDLDSRRAS